MIIKSPQQQDLPALKHLWQQAFEDTDTFTETFFAKGFSPQRCLCLYKGSRPAAALYWFNCQWQEKSVAYLYGVATDRSFQKQGLCRALMEQTHRHLKALGYAGAVLVPSSEGLFSLYEKLGYRSFCPAQSYTVTSAGTQPTPVRPVSPEEYYRLRLDFAPDDSILLSADALHFVGSFARFYAGPDFLCCVNQDGNTLHFQEYLGDPACLDSILTALQAAQAKLRLYAKGPDFAMYLPLENDPQLPRYFGIAMD